MGLFGKPSIKKEIRRRKIKLLLHSTHIYTNLPSILKDGFLRSAGSLRKNYSTQAKRFLHDSNRYEKYTIGLDYINCSVSEPNFELLYKRSKSGWETEWLHFEINLDLLVTDSTLFCSVSAAQGRGKHVQKGVAGFQAMFASEVDGHPRDSIGKEFPTHPQAETLVQGDIPLQNIVAIHVCNPPIAEEVARLCEQHQAAIPIRISPRLFIWPSRLIKK